MTNYSIYSYHLQAVTDDYFGDFLSVELWGGSLLLKYETGGGLSPEKEALVGENINDGTYHHVNLRFGRDRATIVLDADNCTSDVLCYAETVTSSDSLPSFSTELYIGGVPMEDNATIFQLQNDFSLVSTITSLRINHTLIEYASVKSEDLSLGSLRTANPCSGNPCANGECVDLWLSSECSCSYHYVGEQCELLSTAHLTEVSAMHYTVNVSEEVMFEFSTEGESGLLLAISEVSTYSHSRTIAQ